MTKPNPDTWTAADYEEAALAYMENLPLEHFGFIVLVHMVQRHGEISLNAQYVYAVFTLTLAIFLESFLVMRRLSCNRSEATDRVDQPENEKTN